MPTRHTRAHRFLDWLVETLGGRDPAPEIRLADLTENTRARLKGVVAPFRSELLEAPLSGRPCVHYRVTIWVHDRGYISGVHELGVLERALPFVIEEDGARAVIDPASARFFAGIDLRSEASELMDDRQRAVADQLGVSAPQATGRWNEVVHTLNYTEAVVEVGETVTLIAAATRESDPDNADAHPYREGGTSLRITSSAEYPLKIRSLGKLG